jgi:hypothetical protein
VGRRKLLVLLGLAGGGTKLFDIQLCRLSCYTYLAAFCTVASSLFMLKIGIMHHMSGEI